MIGEVSADLWSVNTLGQQNLGLQRNWAESGL
jgi:hypothetical protein